jgi:hypothetical protein
MHATSLTATSYPLVRNSPSLHLDKKYIGIVGVDGTFIRN